MILKEENNFVLKENKRRKILIFWKIKKFLTDTLAKMKQNIFAYSFVSEHFNHFYLFWEKKLF